MKKFLVGMFVVALLFACTTLVAAQNGNTPGASPDASFVPEKAPSNTPISSGNVLVPESSVYREADAGKRMHTNFVLKTEDGVKPVMIKPGVTTYSSFETPASLGCIYKVGPAYTGCTSPGSNQHPTGGWGTIALVDAYDNPYAASDLAAFDSYFGIPGPPSFQQVYANGNGDCGTPAPDPGWSLEESLDVQWAHAMAPNANIVLVEACSNSDADLYYAELVAGSIVQGAGGGDISNSWGGGEYSGEVNDDANFFQNYWQNTVYFASAGDSGCGAAYPSSSPWVVSAGGTTVNRNSKNGYFYSESCWSGSGGGISAVEQWSPSSTAFRGNGMGPWSVYQYPQQGGYLSSTFRHTPDFAFDADPSSGVIMDALYYGLYYGYCTSEPCLFIVGGTSVASPSLAGIVNAAQNRLGQAPFTGGYYTNEENNMLYDQLFSHTAYGKNFYDVKTGTNGCSVGVRWDYCTGVGSPRGLLGK